MNEVTILILIDGFLQYLKIDNSDIEEFVTILILIDGFLQWVLHTPLGKIDGGHNPYFNRWFSAIV